MEPVWNHFDPGGNAVMVDVSAKAATARTAVAEGTITVSRPVLEAMAVAKVKNVVAQTLDAAVAAEISARGVTYGDLITIERDGSGSITALTSDMTAMNELRTGILGAVLTAVEDLDPDRLSIPVGNLTGVSFFSGKGFSLPVEITAAGSAHGVFQSQFTGAGINQTRHNIIIEIHAGFRILTPFGGEDREIVSSYPVTGTVIVGTVPERYTHFADLGPGLLGKISASTASGGA